MSRPLEIEEARALYPQSDLVHGFEHIQRVLALADHLAELEGADRAIVRAAALLAIPDSPPRSTASGLHIPTSRSP